MCEHKPVLLQECLQALRIHPEGRYLDATYGRGGHSRAILQCLGQSGRLFAIDRDPQAAQSAQALDDPRFIFRFGRFSQLADLFPEWRDEGLDGALFDLGVSSPQLEEAERGFSFRHDGPLDMRMNPQEGISAAQWLAEVSQSDLAYCIKSLGNEPHAGRIAAAVVREREKHPLTSTLQLANIIAAAVPQRFHHPHTHPATRSFQAIRIKINHEGEEISMALAQAIALLKPQGRLAVISFHSLEDRWVRQAMRQAQGLEVPREIPLSADVVTQVFKVLEKIEPSAAELDSNPRARSARLRVGEKICG